MKYTSDWLRTSLLIITLFTISFAVSANCRITGVSQTEDNRSAQMLFGRVNLTDTYFQPVGSLLASIVVPPTAYTFGGANASSVLWICDEADLPQLYFLVATNGDDRVGGFHETGLIDGLPGVYASWLAYVGIKQTMAGVVVQRSWKRVPLTTYLLVEGSQQGKGKIHIRLQDIPPMQVELYRVSTIPPNNAASNYCAGLGTRGLGYASATGTNYQCTQPNAYIQFVGPGIVHDNEGEDSAYNFRFWGVDNGFGYGLRQSITLSNNATCVARNATPLVLFPTISSQELLVGGTREADISVQIECSDDVNSGTTGGQTAIGIQVSPGAYRAAQGLNLINSQGGVMALVSDNYGVDPTLATGVGITLRNSVTQQPMVFVSQPGITGIGPSGENAGWYPVLRDAKNLGPSVSGYTHYLHSYTAVLQQLPGQVIKPGKIYATAYVLVKVQ
ncbi:fimbrial protein [Arsenophonus nasoniae]|uniref:fimbrial protein n=1 Tax=Arsenophonus nasoniae TaxID=638 RepID=UPI0038796DAC